MRDTLQSSTNTMDQKGLPEYDSVMEQDAAKRVQPLTMDQVETAMMKDLHGYHELVDKCIAEFNQYLLKGYILPRRSKEITRHDIVIKFTCLPKDAPFSLQVDFNQKVIALVAFRLSKFGYVDLKIFEHDGLSFTCPLPTVRTSLL